MRWIELRGEKVRINDPWEMKQFFKPCGVVSPSGRRNGKSRYVESFMTFDIETTTYVTKDFIDNPNNSLDKPVGFMYTWQSCLDSEVCIGRNWEGFLRFMFDVKKYYGLHDFKRMVVYVHYLSFETSFLKGILPIESVFCKDKRKPMKFIWNGFEFRCSWYLSNMSLEKFCENTPGIEHPKMSGEDFNYGVYRSPYTVLSDDEMGYCYCDVKGLHECIEYRLREDTLASIPLTSTGYVRRDVRRNMASNPFNRVNFIKNRLNLNQYLLISDCFRGGDTHASRFFSGRKVYGLSSRDFKSSYPFVMMDKYFPISPLIEYKYLGDREEFERMLKKYCVMFRVEAWDIHIKEDHCDPYISISMLGKRRNVRGDNGRVLHADYAEFSVTELDWEIINKHYKIDLWNIKECYYSKRGKLPQEFRDVVMKYFVRKTELDGVKGKEYEYVKSKNDLNALFGMIISSIIHMNYSLDGSKWKKPDEIDDVAIEEALNNYYDGWNNFLTYQWGIYVTAHGRKMLDDVRSVVGQDAVYWDTDSLKYFSDSAYEEFFLNYNKSIMKKGYKAKTKNGEWKYLGVFDYEGEYECFKTLGAKKYCFSNFDGFFITVAGMNKELGRSAVIRHQEEEGLGRPEDAFELGVTYENVGRTVSYYHDGWGMKEINVNDERFMISESNVGVVETGYTLGITNEYYELIFGRAGLGKVSVGHRKE